MLRSAAECCLGTRGYHIYSSASRGRRLPKGAVIFFLNIPTLIDNELQHYHSRSRFQLRSTFLTQGDTTSSIDRLIKANTQSLTQNDTSQQNRNQRSDHTGNQG